MKIKTTRIARVKPNWFEMRFFLFSRVTSNTSNITLRIIIRSSKNISHLRLRIIPLKWVCEEAIKTGGKVAIIPRDSGRERARVWQHSDASLSNDLWSLDTSYSGSVDRLQIKSKVLLIYKLTIIYEIRQNFTKLV